MRTGEPPPTVGDVLSALATGLWTWDSAAGTVTLDAEAARLMGLPAEPTTLTQAGARSRLHPVDWNEIVSVVQLAVAEDTLAEVRIRVMDERGRVIRTIRSRSKPTFDPVRKSFELIGTIQEVTEPSPATAVRAPSVTGDWRRSREAFLLDAGRALAEARSTAEVLRVAAGLAMPGFSPDGLAVFGVEADRLTVIGHHGHNQGDEGPFTHMPLETDYPAAEVVRTGRAVYLSSPEEYKARYPTAWPLAEQFGRQSWAFLPLTVAGRTMGAWMAGFTHPVTFTPDERSVLTTVARMLAQALSRAGAAETERELTDGLQRTMLPTLGPEIPGMSVAARYVPTGGGLQVGGDWYDMIALPSGRFALVIGDVQGHDVRAAGLMGQLRIALRAYASEGHRPDAVLSRASRFLHGITDSAADAHPDLRFATCLYVEVDPVSGVLDIARAGHPDPMVRMADGTVLVRPTPGGLPLGIDPDADYPTTRLVLEPGETMLLCTDGLIETGGHDLDTGWRRIRTILESFDTTPHEGEEGTELPGPQASRPTSADLGEETPQPSTLTPATAPVGPRPVAVGLAPGRLEALADALVQGVHGPSSHHTPGPLADRREDDIAMLLLCRESAGRGRGDTTAVPAPTRRTALTIAQAEPERIAGARQQVRELLHDWTCGDQVDSAVLLVSEMLTNVLVHTDADALLVAEMTGDGGKRRMRIEVTDASDDLPHKRHPGELASSGRGLVLMDVLADAWGVDPRGDGKSIWFELYETPPPDGPHGASLNGAPLN
ncbi:SpoIIE family protein phosphatase [Streptomyces caniscabiei]|uniref:SpoIIE family protein phosphatase n=1 Tax=Streptomyces caniscabiei TaxID=2746961 RepID=A0ABU4MGG7_9ACTN|nr:SpoIIE family protein phosphatase [Streptomyces caniscabiei]MBE4734847.1 SpoIIE family protein phosphatase [Streptomyces caniscabiei]MBE4753981.1 SpoIIE family protein phosphatase [Streptomyces caniscabiei]MBE4767574.1 SpoIIE family protein phosphatase [Streptomyces caniscabiei]MBE4784032.1 SpoIIE family protein phosphatase [Streptomyces caniscabiei]MBE4791469.1 SpoIIE family protein phosphatase [Streptomyces caniscabiei]